MAVTQADFNRIWASTSPLTPYNFSNTNYLQGWNFVGSTPPARQMWDKYMNLADQKMQYLYNNYLPLSGGTMQGLPIIKMSDDSQRIQIAGGNSNDGYTGGARLTLYGKTSNLPGAAILMTYDDTNGRKEFVVKPDGTLTWNNKNIERVESSSNNYIRYVNGLQICWDVIGVVTEAGITVTFPQPFVTAPVPSLVSASATANPYLIALTATDMTVKTNNNGGYIRYIAIGRWA